MAQKDLPPFPKTSDYRIHVTRAFDVLAADMNGKSDPYCVIYNPNYPKFKYKSRVVKANLNPVWNFTATLSGVDPNAKIKVEVYDKDTIGKDDFLGEIEINLHGHDVTGKLQKLKLQGKKAKGEIEYSVVELGPYSNESYLGSTWISYLSDVIGDSKLEGRYKLVMDLRTEFIKRAKSVGKSGQRGLLVNEVMDCIKAIVPTGQSLPPDVFRLYEDNNDGVIDFVELCKFIRDIIKLGLGTLPQEAFATQFSYEDGQVDLKSLRKNLDTLVQNKEKKNPELLNAKLDEVAEKMLKAMDLDNSGFVTADELRAFSQDRSEFLAFVRELNSVPDKD